MLLNERLHNLSHIFLAFYQNFNYIVTVKLPKKGMHWFRLELLYFEVCMQAGRAALNNCKTINANNNNLALAA